MWRRWRSGFPGKEGSELQWVEVPSIGVELPGIGLIGDATVAVIIKESNEPLIWAGGTDL